MSKEQTEEKIYLLCDCNNFFASCEKIFRPDLKNRPVAVLSNNDGVVVSRSYETKKLGIAMGSPVFKIQNEINRYHIVTFSSNFNLYLDISNRVMSTLETFCKDLEIYSVDEAFLTFENMTEDQVLNLAFKIKNTILSRIGINIGIGIARTKTLAKLANHYAKKNQDKTNGVFSVLSDHQRQKILLAFPIGEIWGIGRRLEEHLQNDGYISSFDLSKADVAEIKKRYSIVVARTVMELNNIDCIESVENGDSQNQIMWSRSFRDRLYEFDDVNQAISNFTAEVAKKLRSQKLFAKRITVFIRTSYFGNQLKYANDATLVLDYPCNDTRVLIEASRLLLQHIFAPGYAYSKAGVIVHDLVSERCFQSDLFKETPNQDELNKADRLMQTMDSINVNDKNNIRIGLQSKSDFKENKDKLKLSPNYTCSWDDLPEVF